MPFEKVIGTNTGRTLSIISIGRFPCAQSLHSYRHFSNTGTCNTMPVKFNLHKRSFLSACVHNCDNIIITMFKHAICAYSDF